MSLARMMGKLLRALTDVYEWNTEEGTKLCHSSGPFTACNHHSPSHCFLLSKSLQWRAPAPTCQTSLFTCQLLWCGLWLGLKNNEHKAKSLLNTKKYVQQTPHPITPPASGRHREAGDSGIGWVTGWALGTVWGLLIKIMFYTLAPKSIVIISFKAQFNYLPPLLPSHFHCQHYKGAGIYFL